MNGPLPISFPEIKAYIELLDNPLLPSEVRILKLMDTAFLQVISEHLSKETK